MSEVTDQKFHADSSSTRILTNASYAFFRFGVYSLIGFFFVPFLLSRYGESSYGLISLAGFLTQYVGLVSGSFGDSANRYITISLNKDDWFEASQMSTQGS